MEIQLVLSGDCVLILKVKSEVRVLRCIWMSSRKTHILKFNVFQRPVLVVQSTGMKREESGRRYKAVHSKLKN